MAFFNEFPHARNYDSDLGWLIRHVGENIESLDQLQQWAATHKTEYEDLKNKVDGLIDNLVDVIVPWDSSIAYHIFSIVEYHGTNYIALQDVPVGVMITNTDYWGPANTIVEQINAIGVKTAETAERINETFWREFDVNGTKIKNKYPRIGSLQEDVNINFSASELSGNATIDKLQSMCADENYVYLIFIHPTTEGDGIIVKTDLSFNVVSRATISLGHGNDCTVHDGKLYISPGRNSSYGNVIIVVNAETLSVMYTINTIDGFGAWMVSYDEVNDIFYYETDAYPDDVYTPTMHMVTSDFSEEINTFPIDLLSNYENAISQGSVVMDGCFFALWSSPFGATNGSAFIACYSPVDGKIITYYKYPIHGFYFEAEGIAYTNNEILIAGDVGDVVNISKYKYKSSSTAPLFSDTFGFGRRLTTTDSLDNITESGVYFQGGSNEGPLPFGSKLLVISTGINHVQQIAILNSGDTMTRNGMIATGGGYEWTEWYSPKGFVSPITNRFQAYGTFIGYLTSGASLIVFDPNIYVSKGTPTTGWTVEACDLTVRHTAGGYLLTNAGPSSLTFTLAITGQDRDSGHFEIQVRKQDGTAFEATNNIPLAISGFIRLVHN